MTASRQIPPVRTRRVLVSQPLPYETAMGVRSQEGEFVFMGAQRAANEATLRLRQEFEEDGAPVFNFPMFIGLACVLLFLGVAGAAIVTWLAPYVLVLLEGAAV